MSLPAEQKPEAGQSTGGLRAILRTVVALGIVSLFMDTSSEVIHGLLPPFLVSAMGVSVLSVSVVKEFMQLCPHAEYVEVTNAAHMVAADRNDPFGDAIIEFVSRSVTSLDTGRRT